MRSQSFADGSVLTRGTYTLNAAGQRTALAYVAPDGATRNLAWTYDGAGRLTNETRDLPAHATSWTLDAVGNRTNQTKDGQASAYTYDVTDRLTKITGSDAATYTWDTNGQLQSRTTGSGASAQTTTYAFNSRHYLDSVTLPDGTAIRYTYAADGNLESRRRTQGGATDTTHYLVDPNLAFAQVVAEYDDQGHASAVYVYGDELLLRIEPTQSNNATVYHHDGLGSVVALTDEAGTAIQTYGYDAWGNRVESTGSDANPYGYAGERYDADTELTYLRARWYDPRVGRLMSPDSASGRRTSPLSQNGYLYSIADPINEMDPSGYETLGSLSVGQSIAVSLSFSLPYNLTTVALQFREGANLGTALEQAAVNIAVDGTIGAVLPGVLRFAASIVPIRIGLNAIGRAADSLWNLAPFPRGWAIEKLILGRPAQILGRDAGNFPVIDDLTEGVASSIKSIDLTAATYQDASAVIARINEYASKLSQFKGARWGGRVVTEDMIKQKVLVVATEHGGASLAQARALAAYQRAAASLWPDISIVIKAIP